MVLLGVHRDRAQEFHRAHFCAEGGFFKVDAGPDGASLSFCRSHRGDLHCGPSGGSDVPAVRQRVCR